MKLVLKLSKPIEDLTPRHLRDFLASVNKREEYTDKILWHKHIPPVLIYTWPTKKGFAEVINYGNDIEMMEYLKNAVQRGEIYTNSGSAKIVRAFLRSENFITPKIAPAFAVYRTRTPMILASNTEELKEIEKIQGDEAKLRVFLKDFITNSIFHQIKHYVGIEVPEKDRRQLKIDVSEVKFFYVPYPKEEVKLHFPAVKCKVISNFILPRFVGYRIGYGFGELIADG